MLAVDDIGLQQGDALSQFKDYYESFSKHPLSTLADIYAEDTVFVDPLHRLEGLEALSKHFHTMCSGLESCRFEFLDEMAELSADGGQAWFRWIMHYRHPKLAGGKDLTITGASQIKWSGNHGKVTYHEDFYDMGAMLYEQVPVLGGLIRILKKRL